MTQQSEQPKSPEIDKFIADFRVKLDIIKERNHREYVVEINLLEQALLTFEFCINQNSGIRNDVALIFLMGRWIFDTDLWGEYTDEFEKNYAFMFKTLLAWGLIDRDILEYFRNIPRGK